jgi:hypothetical protein
MLGWLALIGPGLWILWSYQNTPGAPATAPRQWPAQSRIKPIGGQATLVMLIHPQCPCTRATLDELDRLMARTHNHLSCYLVFMKPEGFSDDWVKTDLWRHALNIPGVSALFDQGGGEAKLFGAATSGQALLYGADGNLLFSGGLTASRGHAGDNAGEDAIESLVNNGSANSDNSPVFGCPLFNPDSECNSPNASSTDGK